MMPGKTVTKSIRLTTKEAKEAARLSRVLQSGSEAALIREAYVRGLHEIKVERAVNRYLRRDLTVGEVAEIYGLSSADVVHELRARGINPMEGISVEEADENLKALLGQHFPPDD